MKISSVIKTNMIFVISTPKRKQQPHLTSFYQVKIFPTFGSLTYLRGHHLTYDLKTGYRWLRLVTTYTMFFFSARLWLNYEPNATGGCTPLVPSKDAKWPVPAGVKTFARYYN